MSGQNPSTVSTRTARASGRTPSAQSSICWPCRRKLSSDASPKTLEIQGKTYQTDDWTNVPPSILSSIGRNLHLQPDHPIQITRKLIESRFPGYHHHNTSPPVVSVAQNFDSLGFPSDHVGRSKTDTYYINKSTVLRTHTSAHQVDTFRANTSPGFTISADVYRRDAVDRSHYPIFHQMEGAMTWSRSSLPSNTTSAQRVWADVEKSRKHNLVVEDPNPTFHAERNPSQDAHSDEEAEAIATHSKRSLENVVVEIFTRAREAALAASDTTTTTAAAAEPLQVRWIEAYFPFTSPSWELEIFWQGSWLEVLGCGLIQQPLLTSAAVPDRVGWAFGIGLERIAMSSYEIPDIRSFWSRDKRFLDQFDETKPIRRFVPFSKYPAAPRDVAFWSPQGGKKEEAVVGTAPGTSSAPSAAGGLHDSAAEAEAEAEATTTPPVSTAFHENDIMEIARTVAGDVVEDVTSVDSFTHPKTGRKSSCYRISYRSLERTLTGDEANVSHDAICKQLVEKFGVTIR